MTALESLREEWKTEYETTKKFFELYPEGKNDYKVHEKSFRLQDLAAHISEVFAWPDEVIKTSELDFASAGERPPLPTNSDEFLKYLDKNYEEGMNALNNASEEDMNGSWTISMNGQKLNSWPTKYHALRHSASQIIHHRAQLGVNYRLLNVELPPSYGPSADTDSF